MRNESIPLYNERYFELLTEIVQCVYDELALTNSESVWPTSALSNIVLPEMEELLTYACNGKVFFRYGKDQRLLESKHYISDSMAPLGKTELGLKISELQRLYFSLN